MKFSFQRQHTRKARASGAEAKEAKKAARLAARGACARAEEA